MSKQHLLQATAVLAVFLFLLLTADVAPTAAGMDNTHASRPRPVLAARWRLPASLPPAGPAAVVPSVARAPSARLAARYQEAAADLPAASDNNANDNDMPSPPAAPVVNYADSAAAAPAAARALAMRTADGEEVLVESLGAGKFRDRHGVYRAERALVTAYCPCVRCCGNHADGITSTGTTAWAAGAAADPRQLAYGTRIHVPGYGLTVVDDTGGAMRRSGRRGVLHLDMRMTYHYEARQWGRQYLFVRIYE